MTLLAESQTLRRQRTKYIKSVKVPHKKMLKEGKANAKLGDVITIKKWKGLKIYSLTLEERVSCPDYCEQWDNCYGNNMPFGHRFDHTHPDFLPLLREQLVKLLTKHPEGIVIRLHVLGDFFDIDYCIFWVQMLIEHTNLKVFGYTHHRLSTEMGQAVDSINRIAPDQSAIRFSDDDTTEFSAYTESTRPLHKSGIYCPEQTGKTASCATCGYCWSSDQPVIFLEH